VWGKSAAPRVEDIGNNFVSGGVYASTSTPSAAGQRRAELLQERVGRPSQFQVRREDHARHGLEPVHRIHERTNASRCFNNGAPTQVYVFQSPSVSQSGVLSDRSLRTTHGR